MKEERKALAWLVIQQSAFLTINIAAKLTGNTTWPWWAVLHPIWTPFPILAIITILLAIFETREERERHRAT